MLLVAVIVVVVAGFAVYRLNGIFGSKDVTSTPSGAANESFRSTRSTSSWRYSAPRARSRRSPIWT